MLINLDSWSIPDGICEHTSPTDMASSHSEPPPFTPPDAALAIVPSATLPIISLFPSRTHSMITRSMAKSLFESTTFLASKSSSLPSEPNSFAEASQDVGWCAAMAEFDALLANSTWDLVPPLSSINLIGCKWVYKVKQKANSFLECLKTRLVAQGYKQQHGIDFDKTFSPVVKPTTILYSSFYCNFV